MSGIEGPDPDLVQPAHPHHDHATKRKSKSLHEAEGTLSHTEDVDPKHVDHANLDRIDKEVAEYMTADGQAGPAISPEENTRLRRLIDRRVLTIMIATYFLQAIDKGTMSFSSIMGIREDANLRGPEYSWLTTCIYLAILVVEYPQNYIIARVPVAKYLSFSIVAWSVVLACHAACRSFAGLVICRTLLGIFESACQPAFVVLSAMWYRREEQSARVTYWYMMNGAQQIVGGLLAYCFSLIRTGPLKSWQWLYLSYGVISVVFGVFVFLWMPDSPMRAKCFSERDKRLMVERVRANQTGLQNRTFKRGHVVDALADPQTWCYAGIQLTTTLPTSGLGSFYGIIVNESLGFSVLQTQLLAMVLGFYIIFILLGSNWIVNKWKNGNILTMLGFIIPSFVGTILLMTIPNQTFSQHVGLLICYYITLSFWSAQTLGLSLMSRNVGGITKKNRGRRDQLHLLVSSPFIFAPLVSSHLLLRSILTFMPLPRSAGNAIGPQVFLSRDKPRYFIAFATHLGCYALLVVILVFFRWLLVRQNKKRDALAASGVEEASDRRTTHAFEDLTDRENLSFRYVF
ncbi:Major facilitator superfamily transporter [Apiospora rasikravindrae]|uniref:Major facilitator superfamily transporter n=1 Tax=Apiospora rasikravindrae TaxID=990691 RepID=A0ABR1TAG9_9PEZI